MITEIKYTRTDKEEQSDIQKNYVLQNKTNQTRSVLKTVKIIIIIITIISCNYCDLN